MLQFDTLPPSYAGLLTTLRPCFTAPSFRTFTVLVAGMVAQPGRHTVTGMLSAAGLAGSWHHSRAHWFFTHARWCADTLGLAVLTLIVQHLVAPGEALLVAVDDTLFRRTGRKVHATAWHHDGTAKGPGKKVAWGNNWIIAAIVLTLPILDRPVSLPVAFALWTKGGPTKQVLLGRLIDRLLSFKILAWTYLSAAVCIFLIGEAGASIVLLVITVFAAGLCVVGGQTSANALTAEFYPTAMRSTGVGWALGIGRIGSIIGPTLGGILLSGAAQTRQVFWLAAIPVLIATVAAFAAAFIHEKQRLEQVSTLKPQLSKLS